ncbi:hypothetical protein, partial [Propionicimonas sp.]|uniref:hypothetical protein n=1 Tax=Propionicimonas sp. TaxID=1955623 RepID=UPI0039E686DC
SRKGGASAPRVAKARPGRQGAAPSSRTTQGSARSGRARAQAPHGVADFSARQGRRRSGTRRAA